MWHTTNSSPQKIPKWTEREKKRNYEIKTITAYLCCWYTISQKNTYIYLQPTKDKQNDDLRKITWVSEWVYFISSHFIWFEKQHSANKMYFGVFGVHLIWKVQMKEKETPNKNKFKMENKKRPAFDIKILWNSKSNCNCNCNCNRMCSKNSSDRLNCHRFEFFSLRLLFEMFIV